MDPATGTFTAMDTYGGSLSDPMSLHKYLFANSNPVMYSDPSGHEATLQGIVTAMTISAILSAADSGITYYLKYKDSDTAKYGKTVFGWNVATAAMNGFLNGFILGVFFYALCSLLVVRMVLSVIGLCLGIKQGVAGIDEINSSHGNTALGVYNLIKGSILITVSTIGIAQSGMEFLEKYGDGIESFGKADEYPYTEINIKYKTTWDESIIPTQETIEGTNIPKSFVIKGMKVNGNAVWVHGNATKHMGEFVNSANGLILVENELMISFQEAVNNILPYVKPGRNFFFENGWEIGINGDTGVIYHALYRG